MQDMLSMNAGHRAKKRTLSQRQLESIDRLCEGAETLSLHTGYSTHLG